MTSAAFTLNRMLVATMRAERENNRRAKHDALTGLLMRYRPFGLVVLRVVWPAKLQTQETMHPLTVQEDRTRHQRKSA